MFLAYIPPSVHSPMRGPLQGKVAELRFELNSGGKKDKHFTAKKIALKKIVANMTMSNNDMVALFPDIVGCMNIPNLEIKKMWVAQPPATGAGQILTRPSQVLPLPRQLREDAPRRGGKSHSRAAACQ